MDDVVDTYELSPIQQGMLFHALEASDRGVDIEQIVLSFDTALDLDRFAATWRAIAARHSLVEPDLGRLASWWHSDADLGRTIEVLTDMTKSRECGFLGFRATPASFRSKIEQYRAARILP